MQMENVIFALSKAAVEPHTSRTVSALTIASVAFGKIAGRKDDLMLDVVKSDSYQKVSKDLDPQELQRHIQKMLRIGAMGFRASPNFKSFCATLEVWRDGGSVYITENAGSQPASENAENLGLLAESEYLCAACLKAGIEPHFLVAPPRNLEDVMRLFYALEFEEK